MSVKPVVRRRRARQDVEAAAGYYAAEADETVVVNFIAAMEQALDHISHHPASGSPRYAQGLDLPDLRVWPV